MKFVWYFDYTESWSGANCIYSCTIVKILLYASDSWSISMRMKFYEAVKSNAIEAATETMVLY